MNFSGIRASSFHARCFSLVIGCWGVCGLVPRAQSAGLSVQPGELRLANIPVGHRISFHEEYNLPLTIINNGEEEETYAVAAIATSQLGKRVWAEGYDELPDPAWLTIEPKELTVQAHSQGTARMYLTLPDDNRYYNQHWVVSLDIHSLPKPGRMVSLAAYPRFYIETLSKADTKSPPYGILGVRPSVIRLDIAKGARSPLARFRVFNNDKQAHTYEVKIQTGSDRYDVSAGHTWLTAADWITCKPSTLKLGPGKSADVSVFADLRGTKTDDLTGKQEAFLFVRDESGTAFFVRVQLNSAKGS